MQTSPLWPVVTRFPPLATDRRVDVAIVGAGIAGLSSAFHLQNAGYRVAVLEKEEVGAGATGASSGILYYGSGGNFVEAVTRYGRENAAALWNETKRAIKDITSLIEKHRIQCGFRRTGAIMAAKNEQEEARIVGENAALGGIGITTKRLSSDEIQESFRGTKFTAGLSFDVCCVIHPAQFAADLARRFNISVYEKTPMLSFTEEADHVIVRSPKATIRCDRLILATNLESIHGLEGLFEEETTVVLASSEIPNIKEVWPQDKVVWTMEEKYDILYPLGRRLALELYKAREIKQKLSRYYNDVDFSIQQRWGESWAKTSDLLPIVGQLTKRTFAAVAMGDEGIVMGFLTGSRVPLAFEGRTDLILRMTSPDRFKKE